MKADAATEAAVMAVWDEVSDALGNADLDRVLEFLTGDPDLVFFGTGADERMVGAAELKAGLERDLSQSAPGSVSMEFPWRSISAAGDVAWGAGEGSITARLGDMKIVLPVRVTTVLERRDGKWLVA